MLLYYVINIIDVIILYYKYYQIASNKNQYPPEATTKNSLQL